VLAVEIEVQQPFGLVVVVVGQLGVLRSAMEIDHGRMPAILLRVMIVLPCCL